ncbi:MULTISPECIES: MBL fold metallo-hydrolase [unclassified Helicobacter]|uniref:MBL fold metallo-hydrolase n=1 Tax=unclassified Helicobacter TaxID=2593540 RepID=UPI0021621F5E|nr:MULTISPECIES: MBL fold metallo-hydrolase [unclassified Helicobacter]
MTLHSHACLEFKYKDFSFVCDPWIDDYAFFGAWRHYPAPVIKACELAPSALYISHEHSDHCHIESLKQIDKNIPVFIPQFSNGRLEKILANLGFKNVISLEFGKRVKIVNDFYVTIYEPASLWNDSQILLEINGFRILNINDAGINHRIQREVQSVDMICAAFSPGASGYPATYTHLTTQEKIEIYEKSRKATLDMLFEACQLYNATYFLPFASHFILNHPEHIKYMKIIRKNTIYDVIKRFENSNVKVIDLLAGDSFSENKIIKQPRSPNLYNTDSIIKYINDNFDKERFDKYYPSKEEYKYDKDMVLAYFMNLNLIPEMQFCEDLNVSVYPDSDNLKAFSFEVRNGYLELLDTHIESPNLTIKIPSEILMYIVKNNESWDEATIGYWCEFSRNPDIYHTEFWRILQAPFYLKGLGLKNQKQNLAFIDENSNVAMVLESLGNEGQKILSRYGLYCLSCNKAPAESLTHACNMHGISNTRAQRMIKELNVHYLSKLNCEN